MAAGSSYPATFTDESGEVRLDGELNFTDDGNQPAPSGASADIVAQQVQGADSATTDGSGLTVISGSSTATTGSGGALQLYGGNATDAGDGGPISIFGGTGGTSGNGGQVTISGGQAAASSNGNGGDLVIEPGPKDGSGINGSVKVSDENGNVVIQVGPTDNTLGFFSATPVVQPTLTALSTAADIVAALQALGLSA